MFGDKFGEVVFDLFNIFFLNCFVLKYFCWIFLKFMLNLGSLVFIDDKFILFKVFSEGGVGIEVIIERNCLFCSWKFGIEFWEWGVMGGKRFVILLEVVLERLLFLYFWVYVIFLWFVIGLLLLFGFV